MLKLQLLLKAIALIKDHCHWMRNVISFFMIYLHSSWSYLLCPNFPFPPSGFQHLVPICLCCMCTFYLPPPTDSKINHTTFLVILIPSHWFANSYSPSPLLSPQDNISEFLINMNVKNQEVEVHNALSSLTVLEHKKRSEWKQKMDISFLQSHWVKENDGYSTWREVIMFSASVASPQLLPQFGTFCFSWNTQTRSQTIPLHRLKKY